MAEGLHDPARCPIPRLPADRLAAALVRVLPRTVLLLDWARDAEETRVKARNESRPDGSERWYRYFTRADAEHIADSQFSMGMVRFEFSQHLKNGGSLPAEVPLIGGGTGFAITAGGHILTNYHLVSSEIGNHKRQDGRINIEMPCRTLRVQVAHPTETGDWVWRDADEVWLASNPPESRAIRDHGDNTGELREDTALLRVAPAPTAHLTLADRMPTVGEPVWMAGFPLRSARTAAARAQFGYDDANGDLRVSRGTVSSLEGTDYFETDCDGSLGNSGSAVVAVDGSVLGLFSRATGDGPRNLVEYGHVRRVQVSALLAARGLRLRELEGRFR